MRRIVFALMFLFCTVVPASAQKKENANELYDRGAQLARTGSYADAIPVLEKAVMLSPYWSTARLALGRVYLSSDIPDHINKAIEQLKIAADYDKRSADAWFYLGMAYQLKGDYPHAITSYYQAYTIDDTYIAALYNIGSVYDLMGHRSKAVLFYKRYLDAKKIEEEYFNF